MNLCESLINAAAEGKLAKLKKAIALGADPNCRDVSNRTSLHWACQEGHVDIVRCLINAGADVEAQDDLGFTPLVTAAAEGHLEVTAELLKRGASPNIKVKADGNAAALHSACAWGHLEIVKLLVGTRGIDLNLKDDEGHTPLFFAKKGKHREIADYLVAHGAK